MRRGGPYADRRLPLMGPIQMTRGVPKFKNRLEKRAENLAETGAKEVGQKAAGGYVSRRKRARSSAADIFLTHAVFRISVGQGVPAKPKWERCREVVPQPAAPLLPLAQRFPQRPSCGGSCRGTATQENRYGH